MSDDKQRADHFQYLYEQASEGKCGFSGLKFRECKGSICDCFGFEWARRTPASKPFTERGLAVIDMPAALPATASENDDFDD